MGKKKKSIFKKYNLLDSSVTSIASVSTITVPLNGDVFKVTGTTWIATISASWPGRKVIFIFTDATKLVAGNNLKIVSDFTTTSNDTITLVCDGTNWYEACRSVNI